MSNSRNRGTKGAPPAPVIDLRTAGEVQFILDDGTTHTIEAAALWMMLGEGAHRHEARP